MSRRRSDSSYNFYYGFEPTKPIETDEGIKARSRRGAFAANWWAARWTQALERLMDPGRLGRGRRYARQGQVLSIEEHRGAILARVQGSRRKPYKVAIELKPLSDAQWERVADALAEQALFSAQLLAGEMPEEIETVFHVAGVSLFPAQHGDLMTECSCPDLANPCKHIAATHYILGERFDEDPFLIFRLRGRSQEQILEALRLRRAAEDAPETEEKQPEPAPPLEEGLDNFWELGEPLEGLAIKIESPSVEMPLLQRLGEPSYAPQPGLQPLLRGAYRAISRTAQRTAFEDPEE